MSHIGYWFCQPSSEVEQADDVEENAAAIASITDISPSAMLQEFGAEVSKFYEGTVGARARALEEAEKRWETRFDGTEKTKYRMRELRLVAKDEVLPKSTQA